MSLTFKELIESERAQLKPGAAPGEIVVEREGAADEPWVSFTDRDHLGIALSGGGIRSATFNLGLLQALNAKGVLGHADYLSTVSGGGYVGGMWSAWRRYQLNSDFIGPQRQPEWIARNCPDNSCRAAGDAADENFPHQKRHDDVAEGAARDTREPFEIRHLREFSRFLIPRVGFFQSEMWAALTTIFAGTLAALVATTALLSVTLCLWFLLAYSMSFQVPERKAAVFGLLALLPLAIGEIAWRRMGKNGTSPRAIWAYVLWSVVTLAFAVTIFWLGQTTSLEQSFSWHTDPVPLPWDGAGEYPVAEPYASSLDLGWFLPAAAWLGASVALLLLRSLSLRWLPQSNRGGLPAYDRAISRCLAPALVWSALVLIWETAHWLRSQTHSYHVLAGGSPLVFGFLFAQLRAWLEKPKTTASEFSARLIQAIKPMIPQLLATAAMVSAIVWAAVLVQDFAFGPHWAAFVFGSLAIVVVAAFAFDPARMGMHDFYRARICRCFLGAARASGQPIDRATTEQAYDDVRLAEFDRPNLRPIQLVCTTANNLAGDTLTSLYRGARSAVLSRAGVSLGNHTAPQPDLRLSSALTASAAAFNSQMGRLSMDLGPAVAFVMTALNLRLGLWVPNPARVKPAPSFLPGLLYFQEMFGRTECNPDPRKSRKADFSVAVDPHRQPAKAETPRVACHLHLSDGGHFENLALYELVRRHCRYILISDCGADPELAFDDLANAIRCIREDFGVEIELDVAPLRPDERGRARQHAVVGTIHYNGASGLDKGRIVYFKPTLTGDEPPDVVQYQKRNASFPNESTGDQFYDEAQWESYRKLGEHAVNAVFTFTEDFRGADTRFVDKLFLEAGRQWHSAPNAQHEIFLALTERCAALEADIRDNAPVALRQEFFPEMLHAALVPRDDAAVDESKTPYYLMMVIQVMEDVWIGAELDKYWSHPLNEGWMNYFQRWASTPSFRQWWPVLRSIYCIGFRDFARDRFDLPLRHVEAAPARGAGSRMATARLRVPEKSATALAGMAWDRWCDRYGRPAMAPGGAMEYLLQLESTHRTTPAEIQVGFLLYRVVAEPARPTRAEWTSREMFIPHALEGAGLTVRFLDALIAEFRSARPDIGELRVTINVKKSRALPRDPRPEGSAPHRPGRAERILMLQTLNFYKSRGFTYAERSADDPERRVLRLDLRSEHPDDPNDPPSHDRARDRDGDRPRGTPGPVRSATKPAVTVAQES